MFTNVIFITLFLSSTITTIDSFAEKTNSTRPISVSTTASANTSTRHGKFVDSFLPYILGIGGLVRITNSLCAGTNSLDGLCYTDHQCKRLEGGVSAGTCARNKGVCCVVLKNCGDTANHNNTYFQNPGFPSAYTGGGRCTITIAKCDSTICQVRIDFIRLSLAQPIGGVCSNDALTITGGAGRVLRICGDNDGQHVYVDFNSNATIQMVFDAPASFSFNRYWQIKVSQIGCDSVTKAPAGCMQYYYSGTTGVVRSFNFGTTLVDPITTSRQVRNLNYGICFLMQPGYCQITYAALATNTFVVSETGGVPNLPQNGAICTDNYVGVPFPTGLAVDRFCGSAFPTSVVSTIKPFVLYYVTSSLVGGGTFGFSIRWTQNRCNNNLIL